MKDSIFLSTPEHAALEFELAGLGSRFLAHLIDLLFIVLALVGFWLILFLGAIPLMSWQGLGFGSYGIAMMILIFFVVMWGYFFLIEGYFQGITPGKKYMGLRVLREDGLPIGFYESAVRNFLRAADAFPPPTYALGGIVMHLDPSGKRLGDMVAGTIVIRETFPNTIETRTGAAWVARVEQGHSRKPLSLPGGNITVKQLDLIEQYLSRNSTFPIERRQALAQSMADPLWKISGRDKPEKNSLEDILLRDESFLQELLDLANEQSLKTATTRTTRSETTFF